MSAFACCCSSHAAWTARHGSPQAGNAPRLFAEVSQALRGGLLVRKGEEGAQIGHTVLADGVDVIFKIFGVGDDDWTVEVVLCARRLLMLIEHTGVEDGPDTVVDEPLYMAVGQLGGVALGLGGDGLHAQLIDLARGARREQDGKAELPEECCPERVVLIEIQHARDANGLGGLVNGHRRDSQTCA